MPIVITVGPVSKTIPDSVLPDLMGYIDANLRGAEEPGVPADTRTYPEIFMDETIDQWQKRIHNHRERAAASAVAEIPIVSP